MFYKCPILHLLNIDKVVLHSTQSVCILLYVRIAAYQGLKYIFLQFPVVFTFQHDFYCCQTYQYQYLK